eukprot:CAMPEP_0184326090 /NCGR_PEP_ID=MMETSP1049-20130417/142378_1 /TAXON_ID=77928 /ORGANISM="Proteomonas sulcata, Strain CCMP704" /LENGTH=116 /DNA_ID=CAMNT_0026648261 /DNA_START=240 /DNA_END=590 /DNA_ORIENTATION=-
MAGLVLSYKANAAPSKEISLDSSCEADWPALRSFIPRTIHLCSAATLFATSWATVYVPWHLGVVQTLRRSTLFLSALSGFGSVWYHVTEMNDHGIQPPGKNIKMQTILRIFHVADD